MKRLVFVFASIAALAISCTANPPILPEPNNVTTGVGGFGGDGGAGGMSTSANSSSSASGSSGILLSGDGSGTRLRRRVHVSPDGLLASASIGSFYDSLLGFDCLPTKTPNGTRCMPLTAIGIVFSDSSCSAQVAVASTICGEPTTIYARTQNVAQGICDPTPAQPDAWYQFGAKLPITFGHRLNGGTCVTYNPSNVSYYELGTEVDYLAFAPMSSGIE
jgi:hypothetical protein